MKDEKLEPFTYMQYYTEKEYVSLYYYRKFQKSIDEKLKIFASVIVVTLLITMYSRFEGTLSPFYELFIFGLIINAFLRPIFIQLQGKRYYKKEIEKMNPLMITIDHLGILLTWEGGSLLTTYDDIHKVEEDSRYYLFFLDKYNFVSIPKYQVNNHHHNNLCKWVHLNIEKEKIKKNTFLTKYE